MDRQSPFICGEKVYLRPMEHEDYDLFCEMWNDARLGKSAGQPYPITKDQLKGWFDSLLEDYGKKGFYFSACRWEDDAVVAMTCLWHIDPWVGQGEFSICLSKAEFLGQGYGTDIARTILDFGFITLGLQRIYLTCAADDPRSTRCYQKVGYVIEGRQRRVHRVDGQLNDSLIMSILREEWEALKAKN